MFGSIVLDIDGRKFINAIDDKKKEKKIEFDTELSIEDLKALAETFKKIIKDELNLEFPEDVMT